MSSTVSLPEGLSAAEVQAAVRDRYSQVGTQPEVGYNFQVGRAFAEALGYPKAILDQLPPGVYEAFTGVATPSLRADLRPGEVVVDLGCGGGLDLSLSAWTVGPRGRVVGIDFAPGMVDRARRNIELLNLRQAEVRVAPAEATGLGDASADWVIANGILNLSPDKHAVLQEIVRILRPGGRFLLAETALSAPLPAGKAKSLQDWFR
jgi:arsenite methyltransferase